jgi:NTP pyrophosphatase (non-canonical NTP hydrolase)
MIRIDDYQEWTRSTVVYGHGTEDEQALYEAVKLVAEAGEVGQVVAKGFRDGGNIRERLIDELGDVEWYLARIRDRYGITRGEVLAANKAKLERRQANGAIGGSGDR